MSRAVATSKSGSIPRFQERINTCVLSALTCQATNQTGELFFAPAGGAANDLNAVGVVHAIADARLAGTPLPKHVEEVPR